MTNSLVQSEEKKRGKRKHSHVVLSNRLGRRVIESRRWGKAVSGWKVFRKLNGPSLSKVIHFLLLAAVFSLVLEASARIDDKVKYDAPFFGRYSSAVLTSRDPEGIKHNIPNARYEKWRINNLGFRGPDITLRKPKSVVRIVCMGTSETFGLYESPSKEWPRQLAEMLKNSKRFQVVNTSVVGLVLNDFIPYFKRYVLKIEPDIAILSIDPFAYAVGADKFEHRQGRGNRISNSKEIGAIVILEKAVSSLRILPKIRQVAKGLVPLVLLKKYQIYNLKRQLFSLKNFRLKGEKPMDLVPQQNLYRFQSDLEELVRFLQARNIHVVLCSHPALISPENLDQHIEIFLDFRRFYVELSLRGIIDASIKFNNLIKSFSKSYGIDFVDTSSVMPKTTYYFADNVHYTDEGAHLLAKSIFRYIQSGRIYKRH